MSQSQHAAAEVTGSWQEDIHTHTNAAATGWRTGTRETGETASISHLVNATLIR